MTILISIILLVCGLILLCCASYPYLYYISKLNKPIEKHITPLQTYPHITIVVNAYREGKLVEKRVNDILQSDYPKEKIKLLLINDGADKETGAGFRNALKNNTIDYELIEPETRLGKPACQNLAINKSGDEIIVFTDADITSKSDSLTKLIESLMIGDVGAVSADVQPVGESRTVTETEHAYRSIYGKMCEYDSSLDSTYNFNGPLLAFKKSAVKHICETGGADDANLAMECITAGYRAIYVSDAIAFELQPATLQAQFKQKIRRADGLVHTTRMYAKKGKGSSRLFWKKTFPIRKHMLLVSPILFVLATIFLLIGLFILSLTAGCIALILLLVILLLSIIYPKNILSSFILNQFFLTVGLIRRKNIVMWDHVDK